ncbi:hypothetical protein QTO34_000863 [Cnephaeus nilssonii]|uniref:Inactive peptidyl-prolyl cis-trans isomerase FKBP6 n=1 Tax=Cnephaeus nilssonii TaxID=3371016 RepID=A0AA40ICD6_CNENI|nr:hypothetical protein QTO34_000863 [Eptesicus nilssonii]
MGTRDPGFPCSPGFVQKVIPKDVTAVDVGHFQGPGHAERHHLRGKTPWLMKLGEDITLCVMELGLLSMRRGELARFLFKPTYAYETLGNLPLIPKTPWSDSRLSYLTSWIVLNQTSFVPCQLRNKIKFYFRRS